MKHTKRPNLRLNGKEYCAVCLTERNDPFPNCPTCFGLILENGRWVQPLRGVQSDALAEPLAKTQSKTLPE